jgi:hypothetical protein
VLAHFQLFYWKEAQPDAVLECADASVEFHLLEGGAGMRGQGAPPASDLSSVSLFGSVWGWLQHARGSAGVRACLNCVLSVIAVCNALV